MKRQSGSPAGTSLGDDRCNRNRRGFPSLTIGYDLARIFIYSSTPALDSDLALLICSAETILPFS
jgi:hypothetical protein